MGIGTALVIYIGAKHALSGALSVGDIVVFTSYLAPLCAPINTPSGRNWGVIQSAKVGVQRVRSHVERGNERETNLWRDDLDSRQRSTAGSCHG
jgi:ABC-type bacteriocin/lantibiotic exporter with double-glycine peptidase domain